MEPQGNKSNAEGGESGTGLPPGGVDDRLKGPSDMRQKLRYVVLLHEGYGETHQDWMVEKPGQWSLATWRISESPDLWDHPKVERIADHRREYLTYEGEVSGGRGRVKRVWQGVAYWEGDIVWIRAGDGWMRLVDKKPDVSE